jgi:type III secretion protein D
VEQGISQPIENRIREVETGIPFDIVQVTSGRYGNIVTDTGDRLFVGDQFLGYQLIAIQEHHVIFSGKSRVTIAW